MAINTSPHNRSDSAVSVRGVTTRYRQLKPFSSDELRVLLLENVSPVAVQMFKDAGYQVDVYAKSLGEDELLERLTQGRYHALGIRSKTSITRNILEKAPYLLSVGCFCIGTNQVDLDSALSRGVSVFNSPFANSRSVAEMTISNIVALSRQLGDRNIEMHEGKWRKVSKGCKEIRGKVLGIIGYGNIGSQLSVMAEAMGMKVQFYDIRNMLPHGCAIQLGDLDSLLSTSDFVSLHVPETTETKALLNKERISKMKSGSCLINSSRGTVVDLNVLAEAVQEGRLGGAAIDVFPVEPSANDGAQFETPLAKCKNVILTPHIGGSTEEAQDAIGIEVAAAMIRFLNEGCTMGSVNFPNLDLRSTFPFDTELGCRILNIHQNVPGVLLRINTILSEFNVEKQICESRGPYSYVQCDVATKTKEDMMRIFERIYALPESVATRIVY